MCTVVQLADSDGDDVAAFPNDDKDDDAADGYRTLAPPDISPH